MIKKITIVVVLFTGLLYSSCNLMEKKDDVALIKTPYGDMVAILYEETPKHKQNFIKLVNEKFYDSLLFHRVIENFMIQGGDPDSRNAQPGQRLGNGGPGYTVEAEINEDLYHVKGALSAARMGDAQNPTKASSGSQFYIVQGRKISQEEVMDLGVDQVKLSQGMSILSEEERAELMELYRLEGGEAYRKRLYALIPRIEQETGETIMRDVPQERIDAYTSVGGTPHLDNQYTVFGRVVEGLDVIDKIAAVDTDSADRPVVDIPFSVVIEKRSKKEITEKYGYQYPEKEKK